MASPRISLRLGSINAQENARGNSSKPVDIQPSVAGAAQA